MSALVVRETNLPEVRVDFADNTLLAGIVGSTAYGLATPESDIDRLAIHATETNRLFTIQSTPPETLTGHDPDWASHDLRKACSLMFGGNPTVLEILWLDAYEVKNHFGEELIGIRDTFLSRSRVRDAYLGYATQQLKRLEERGRFQGSLDTRRPKHARHLLRLLEQGVHLYETGELRLRVENPQLLREAAEAIAANDEKGVALAHDLLKQAEEIMDNTISPLPVAFNTAPAEDLIQRVRRHYWKDLAW
ncbi:DNA polymerase beta superfamily protein [Rhodococcus sp. ACS1]|uniref:nucleotidyltransferase domain-containing protein n=1 Tax=Rhodococcus sp. ACS1 TaxID=2028570 RepID=UPI0015CEE082|nr:nucleotidyltransferase domain-containing protein [Rhodococcus sp. ACS1]